MSADTYRVRAEITPGRSMDNESFPRAALVGFLNGVADGMEQNPAAEVCLVIAPAVDLPSFSDLGDMLVPFQGGHIILRGFGCGCCGNGHWAEDDPARRRETGSAVACPHCGKPSVLPEVGRG